MIVITGASDGLGLSISKLYHHEGKTVVNISRTSSRHASKNIKADLTEEGDIKRAAAKVMSIDERLEVIINAAGVHSPETLDKITAPELERVFKTNVMAPILLTSALYDRIISDETDIVNVSSTLAHSGRKDRISYGTSKWAVRGFSENLRQDLSTTNSRVINFSPGGFLTDLYSKAHGNQPYKATDVWMDKDEVAKLLKSLLSLPKIMEVSEIIVNRNVPNKK